MYVEDGEYYRAKVLIVKKWKNTAVVQFTEYGNEEEVDMANMTKLEHRPSKVSCRVINHFALVSFIVEEEKTTYQEEKETKK